MAIEDASTPTATAADFEKLFDILHAAKQEEAGIACVEDLVHRFDESCPKAFDAITSMWSGAMSAGDRLFWMALVGKLAAHRYWESLRSEPRQFNKALEGLLDDIRSTMRSIYRVPETKPVRLEVRDRRIWDAKRRDESKSFGEIGLKFKLSRQATRESYFRQAAREKERLDLFIQTVRATPAMMESINSFAELERKMPDMAATRQAVQQLPALIPPPLNKS